ncbi:MAG: nuclear transport factor 2 family protein [Pseudomonadales bacterium]
MTPIEVFFQYAGEFEKSYEDNNWSRLYGFFHDDATYTIVGEPYSCCLTGPEDIFVGMRKSLDGMDRRFDTREIALDGEFQEDGDDMTVSWRVTYGKQGLSDFVLGGTSRMTISGDKISALSDEFPDASVQSMQDWMLENKFEIDPSYV